MRFSKSFRSAVSKIILHVIVLAGVVLFIIPFIWMVSTSLKPPDQVYTFPPEWIPKPFLWSNYTDTWAILPTASMTLFFKNTCIVTFFNLVGTVLSSSVVAFGFARLRFRGRNILFLVLLSTMMIPPQVTMVPLYVFFTRLGWVNTFKPLIVPFYFGRPFSIFLLRQFFMTVPREIDDAAKIDGCSIFGLYWRIMLPLSKPALAMIGIFSFTYNWNNFLNPLIYLNSIEKFTIALGLRVLQDQWEEVAMGGLMAMSTVALLPMLIVFFLAQKYFIQGVTITGVKG